MPAPQTAFRRRNGFALLIALVAIAVVAALTLAALLRTDQEGRIVRAETLSLHALTGAEAALWSTVSSPDIDALRAMAPGSSVSYRSTEGPVTTNVTVLKVDTTMLWIVSDAEAVRGRDVGHHRVALSATLPSDSLTIRLSPVPQRSWIELF